MHADAKLFREGPFDPNAESGELSAKKVAKSGGANNGPGKVKNPGEKKSASFGMGK